MPLHDYLCLNGHRFERVTPIAELSATQHCNCGAASQRVFMKFPAAYVQADVHYDSPIDGRPVTTRQARIEDLARNNCVEYDPEMKKDATRKHAEQDSKLDRELDATVESEISRMPARKRELLAQELSAGADLNYVQSTPS